MADRALRRFLVPTADSKPNVRYVESTCLSGCRPDVQILRDSAELHILPKATATTIPHGD